jgi:hypothetical protein
VSSSCPARTKEAKTGQKSRTSCIFSFYGFCRSLLAERTATLRWQYWDASGLCPARKNGTKINRKSKIENQKSGIRNWKSEIGNRKSEIGNRKSEIGNRKSEIGNRKLKIKNLKSNSPRIFLPFIGFCRSLLVLPPSSACAL